MPRDRKLYDVLEVSPDASRDEIRRAYRKLARQYHPDRNPGDAAAERRFKEINAAHEVLSDPEKRKLYDEFGEDALRAGFDAERARAWRQAGAGSMGGFGVDFDMGDIFEELFGGSFRGARAGRTIQSEITVDFHTAARGGERDLRFADGRSLTVRIPPGVRDGESLRLRGKGEPGPGGAGDLVLTVHVTPHPVFRREGDDLHLVLPVTVGEALLGATLEVPTLDGTVKLKIPPGSQSGRRLRLRGKGIARRGRPAGDLYAELSVRVPETVDERVREAVEVLDRAYAGDVRADLNRLVSAG